MKLGLHRKYKKQNYTIGQLFINGELFCNTIEDRDRGLDASMSIGEIQSKKLYTETAIPTGTYRVTLTYSNKFKRILPLINNVKGFEGIRIHRGNTAKDSAGCPIVGLNTKKGMVTNSTEYEKKLIDILTKAKNKGEEITIEIY